MTRVTRCLADGKDRGEPAACACEAAAELAQNQDEAAPGMSRSGLVRRAAHADRALNHAGAWRVLQRDCPRIGSRLPGRFASPLVVQLYAP